MMFSDINFRQVKLSAPRGVESSASVYKSIAEEMDKLEPIDSRGGLLRATGTKRKDNPHLAPMKELIVFAKAAIEGEAWGLKPLYAEPLNPGVRTDEVESAAQSLAEFIEPVFDEIDHRDPNVILTIGPAWFALGAIWHDLTQTIKAPDLEPSIAKLSELSWRWDDPIFADLFGPAAPGARQPYEYLRRTGKSHHHGILKALRAHLGLTSLLREKKG
jgi:hypothetical protein